MPSLLAKIAKPSALVAAGAAALLAVGVLAVLPLAPAQAHPARATSWTREDPSFPFRWAPCRPIPYRVNLGGTSHRNLKVLKAALADVSAATGFTFEYAGTTHAVPYARGRDSAHQVPAGSLTIAWATPRKVPSLAGGVVGLAGPGGSYRRVGTDWQIDSGAVVLDKTAHLTTAMVDGPSMMSLILHELGHALVARRHDVELTEPPRVDEPELAPIGEPQHQVRVLRARRRLGDDQEPPGHAEVGHPGLAGVEPRQKVFGPPVQRLDLRPLQSLGEVLGQGEAQVRPEGLDTTEPRADQRRLQPAPDRLDLWKLGHGSA